MKHIITVLIFSITFINAKAQSDFDVRKVNWDMTINEVIQSEYPLTPSTKTDELVEFDKVFVGKGYLTNGFEAKLKYTFKNKRLSGLEYVVSLIEKTENAIFQLTDKVSMTKFIFDALESKGYQCYIGWHTNSLSSKKRAEMFNDLKICSLEYDFVKKIEDYAKAENDIHVYVNYENDRSSAGFCFYEFQNSETTADWAKEGKLFCTIEFEPSFALKKQMEKSGF